MIFPKEGCLFVFRESICIPHKKSGSLHTKYDYKEEESDARKERSSEEIISARVHLHTVVTDMRMGLDKIGVQLTKSVVTSGASKRPTKSVVGERRRRENSSWGVWGAL